MIRAGLLLALVTLVSCAAPAPPTPHKLSALRTETALVPPTAISGTTPIVSRWVPLPDSAAFSLQLTTDGTVSGSWLVELSDKPGVVTAGDTSPSDVTAGFQTPAGTAIAAAAGSPTSQFVQAKFLQAGAFRVTFTPTSGAGNVTTYASLP